MVLVVEPTAVVVVVDQIDTYQLRLLDGVRAAAGEAGLSVLVQSVDPRAANLPPTFGHLLASGRIYGVIGTQLVSSSAHSQIMEVLGLHDDIPVTHVGPHPKADAWTTLDNSTGMGELFTLLFDDLGVRRPVVLRGIPHQPDSQQREELVRAAMAQRGLTLDPQFLVEGEFARMKAYRAMSALLRTRRDLDAVIAFNDRSAMGAADALRQAGLRVPEDVVVTGFDNEPAALEMDPPLTTVDQDLPGHGRAAVEMLLSLRNGEPGPSETPVATRLVVRESTHRDATGTDRHDHHLDVQIAANDVSLAMSRSFMASQTIQGLTEEIVVSLPRLGVNRCLMVLDNGTDATPAGTGRLVLDFDAAAGRDLRPGLTFPIEQVLPDDLMDVVCGTNMVMQPLSIGDDHYGYAIFDSVDGRFSGETLQLDLSRALSTIESRRRLAEYAEELERRVAQRTQQLELEVAARRRTELDLVRANAELRKSVFIDGLTRIANRTALDESLVSLWRDHEHSDHTLSMILIDVDHFKAYNDHYGHLRGDEVLRTVAACLTEAVRGRDDLAARYGGEEFAVLLPQTDEAGASVVAERIRRLVKAAEIPHGGQPASSGSKYLSVSLGVASVQPAVEQVRVDHLIARADQAMYRAKATGRDRVATASECDLLHEHLDGRAVPTGWQI